MKNGREHRYVTLRIPLPLYYYLEKQAATSGESISAFCVYGLIHWARNLLRGRVPYQQTEYLPKDLHEQLIIEQR